MKNSIFTRSFLFLLALIMVFTLAACGGANNNAEDTSDEPEQTTDANKPEKTADTVEAVKLRIMWWGSQSRHDATLKALELYTSKNPNITFEPEFSGWDGYWDKLSTQAAAKNAPDIIQMDAAYLNDYAGRDQLADLSTGINTSAMDTALVDSGKYKDTLYAIALGNNAFGIAYNKEALTKLGVTMPKVGWTWEEFWAMGRQAKEKLPKDKYVLMDSINQLDMFGIYQMSKGKGYYVTDDGKFNMDKDTWLEFAKTYGQLRKEGVVPPAQVTVTDKELDPNLDLLAKGDVLVRRMHAAQSTALDSLKPGAMALVTMPRGDKGGGWLKPSMFWSVSKSSKHVEEAKKFIDWFINDKEVADILGTSRGVPVSKDVLAYIEPKLTAADKMGIDLIRDTIPIAQPFKADPKGWGTFRNKEYVSIVEKMQFGQITEEQAWDEIVKKAKEFEL